MRSLGANFPRVDLSQDDDASISASSLQGSLPLTNNTQPQRQLLPRPDMSHPAQILPPSPADPQENQEPNVPTQPRLAQTSGAYLSFSSRCLKHCQPSTSVRNIMKEVLPAGVSITKEANEIMGKFALEFIKLLTNEGLFNPLIRATFEHPVELTRFSPYSRSKT